METILRSEARKIIDSGVPFSLSFVKADRRRGLAGEYVAVTHYQKVNRDTPVEAMPHRPELKPLLPSQKAVKVELIKDPNHQVHKTFNIFNPANPKKNPIKVHYRLMHIINEKLIVQ